MRTASLKSQDKEVLDNGASKQRLLLGTHTSNDEQNYLIIAEMILPVRDSELQIRDQAEESATEAGIYPSGFASTPGKFRTVQQISHDGRSFLLE